MWNRIKKIIQKILPKNTEFDSHKMVYQTSQRHMAEIMKLKLEGEGVPVTIIDKMDSSYNSFGQVELYVNQNLVVRAKYIIGKSYE